MSKQEDLWFQALSSLHKTITPGLDSLRKECYALQKQAVDVVYKWYTEYDDVGAEELKEALPDRNIDGYNRSELLGYKTYIKGMYLMYQGLIDCNSDMISNGKRMIDEGHNDIQNGTVIGRFLTKKENKKNSR